MDDRVVITGTGMVTSLGLSASETWNALLAGKSGIKPIDDFDAGGFDCRAAAQVNGLNPSDLGIHPRDARIMDKHSFMLMKCSHDAYRESRIDRASIEGEDIGFFAGMGMVDYNRDDLLPALLKSRDADGNLDYKKFFSGAYQEIHPLWPLSMLNNISFSQVAISLDIRGENAVFAPHADSGAAAIAEAVRALFERKAKIAIAGGVSEKVSPSSLARADLAGILSKAGNKREAACRPFSADRNGTLLGEGCGILALELLSSAHARRASCKAMITGYGFAFDALSIAMRSAIENAGLIPSDIDVVIAHGDGTHSGDKNEAEAINQIFSDCMEKIFVYSSKGALGNMFAGAPAVNIILGVHMLEHGLIPATLNAMPLDKSVRFNLVHDKPLRASPKRIMVNSQSYEGQCASLIIEAVD
ncbi:MAG: beta-ketoacyl synthase N-terminal-like domain-containing protein [Nitrospirota bacterium]